MFHSEKRRRYHSRGEGLRAKSSSLDAGRRWDPFDPKWIQTGIAIASFVLLTLVLGLGAPSFAFREGQRTDREVRLRVDVEIFNETKTRNNQEESALQSPLVFTHNPQAIIDLREKLRHLAKTVAQHPQIDELDSATREQWKGLTNETFTALRTLVQATALEEFEQKLDQALQPILEYGVLDESALPHDKSRTTSEIHIFTVSDPQKRTAIQDDVLLPQISRPDGPLAKRLKTQWPNGEDAQTLFGLIVRGLRPTLTYDGPRTQQTEENRRQQILDVFDKYSAGDLVVPRNEPISEEQLRLLRAEHRRWLEQLPASQKIARLTGLAIIVLAVVLSVAIYLNTQGKEYRESSTGLAIVGGLAVVTLLLARLLRSEPYHAEILPITVTSLLLAIAYRRSFALTIAFGLALLTALMQSDPIHHFVVLLGGAGLGILMLDSVRSRSKLITVGFGVGVAYGFLTMSMGLLTGQSITLVLHDAVWQFGCGLIAGFLVSGSLPFIESIFGIVTDISLIELADTSHALLQELVRRAPGTYNHSVTVSIIGETAAKCIGCNALSVRVGALFHDLGKMLKPNYFIENKSHDEENRHNYLEPALSTLIIIGHVKDGIDLARQHHLPQPIVDLIEQHHGTTLVDYFYHEATWERKEADNPEDESVEESLFRYPGPLPASKEAGVLMLADCVESASRALSEPTPASIEKLVRNLALNRLLDGQFSESGLTLQEIKIVQDSLTKSLISVYHGRIKYPVAV